MKGILTTLLLGLFLALNARAQQTIRSMLETPGLEYSDNLRLLFSNGVSNMPEYVRALDDSDQRVSRNAQLMLRLIGGSAASRVLANWYQASRENRLVATGALPAPLTEWEYHEIASLLQQPVENWQESDALNDAFGLALDGSPTALSLLHQMQLKAATAGSSTIFKVIERLGVNVRTPFCQEGELGHNVVRHSFFLSDSDQKTTTGKVVAKTSSGERALVREFSPFGDSYLVVMIRSSKSCWQFESVSHIGINN